MQSSDVRNIVRQQFYRTLSESGVQITAIPPEQLQTMVDAFADSLFAVLDSLEEEGMPLQGTPPPDAGHNEAMSESGSEKLYVEKELWRGRPYLTIGTRYELTSERLRIVRGIFGNRIDELELVRVRDTRVKQHAGERMLNVGDITVFSTDPTAPELVLHNVRNPVDVRELIRKVTMEEKARRGLYYREDIAEEEA